MISLNRDLVDDKYSVLEFVPQYEATETLEWATNIFIAADLSENRRSLSPYPAITITYSFDLSLDNRDFLFRVLDPDHIKDTWVLPYYPHSTPARVFSGQLAIDKVVTSDYNVDYPYHEYWMAYSRTHMEYGKVSDYSSSLIAEELWAAPCYKAVINPQLSTVDMGECRYGHTVDLTFRMTADSEKAMTYHFDDFPFYDAMEIPVNTTHVRRQSVFAPVPSGIYSYNPTAYRSDQTSELQTNYFLKYDDYYREDYPFRGVFMKGLGIAAGEYGYEGMVYRLAGSSLQITYHQGYATASALLRQVAA